MKNLKIIPPTLREKKRYILFKIIPEPEENFDYSDLEAGIWNTLLDFLGERGVADTSVWILKDTWDPKNLTAIIRCNNKSTEKIIASLGLIDRLGDNRISFKILKISGTIKGLGLKK